MDTQSILRDLIAFPTVSVNPNRSLIDYCTKLLTDVGADVTLIEDKEGHKANLYATIGPQNIPGVLLSGHTDVVPVEGQDWSVAPFEMSEADGKFFGRGTTDMKGFVASALNAAIKASRMDLKTPLHLALSYDEEIGCVGVRSMIDMLKNAPFKPRFCIVGEPTSMQVATGHKGKTACKVTCTGREAHSALAPNALNAIHLVCDMISFIRELQDELANSSVKDDDYDIPYTTLHVANIHGGIAGNIVPKHADFRFEIRNIHQDNPQIFLERIRNHTTDLLAPYMGQFPEADINIDITNSYPSLNTDKDAEVVGFVNSLIGLHATIKVSFGTEGGLFSSELGIPTVVCGPGSMEQGHKPDEFVSKDQLSKCDAMLDNLLDRLTTGI
jgi:acetylornithine deacetylase